MCKLAKYVRNCVAFWEFLHSLQKFYTTTGRNKFQVWVKILKLMLGRDSDYEIWSRFVFELVWTFVSWTQPSAVPLAMFAIETHHWSRGRRTKAHGQRHTLQLFSCPSSSHLCPWLAAHIFCVNQWSPKLCKPGQEPQAWLISDKLSFRQEFPSVYRNRNPCRNYAFSSLIQGILKTMDSTPS